MGDFPDIARHLAQGADVETRLPRGRGVGDALDVWSEWWGRDEEFARPLHACAAMHRFPGAYETSQLLIAWGADLNAKDREGDTTMAHVRYFGATEFQPLYSGHGARLAGPFYRRFQERDA